MLSEEHKNVLLAFMECFDLHGTSWPEIENNMREDFGIEDPESDLEDARAALAG